MQAAYEQEAEMFYGSTDTVWVDEESPTLSECSVEGYKIATEDDGREPFHNIETGDEDMPDFVLIGIDDERKLVVSELEKGCGFPEACYKQFDEDEVYSIRLTMAERQRHEKDMLLLGKLHVVANATDIIHHARQTRDTARKRVTYRYVL